MSELKNNIRFHGHPGKYKRVTKWTGGQVTFTGTNYGAGALIISGSQVDFDQEAYVKLTDGGSILLKDLAAANDDFFELSIAELSGSGAGDSVTPGAAPNRGIEFIQTGVVYVLHRNTTTS